MKLAFCVICRGDEDLPNLKKLFDSVKEVKFDSIHLTANGENTKEVEKWVKENGWDYSYLKWDKDFGRQRNFNFARAPKETDYIVWADSDDVVVNAYLLRDIAQTAKDQAYDVVFFDYWYSAEFDGEPSIENYKDTEITQKRERLINPRKITWKKKIHETPVPLDGENFRYSSVSYSDDRPITWLHLGADRDMPQEEIEKRMDRNKELLELELADERKNGEADPRTILYLMKIYAEYDDEELLMECIELGKEYLEKSGWDEERAVCLQLMSKCIGKLGRHEEARNFLLDAIKEYPYNPLLHLYLARAYFNLNNYRAMRFWMKIGMSLELDEANTSMGNILEMKMLSAELMVSYYMKAEKNVRKALEAAKILAKVHPHPQHIKNVEVLTDLVKLDEATEHAHMLMNYLRDNNKEYLIERFYEDLPEEIQKLPFMVKYYNRFKKPRTWGENEICYFANFGQFHVQKWDGNSLKDGLGGSETAVIRLAEEWTKLGFKVTVYGDPQKETVINGVNYVPFYKFNQRDNFNIFIQWRNNSLAGKVCAKKFIVDLHDISHSSTHETKLGSIDKIAVKSNYHRENIKDIPDEKVLVISNGI